MLDRGPTSRTPCLSSPCRRTQPAHLLVRPRRGRPRVTRYVAPKVTSRPSVLKVQDSDVVTVDYYHRHHAIRRPVKTNTESSSTRDHGSHTADLNRTKYLQRRPDESCIEITRVA